ncbi:hypothetical protein PVAP13_3NG140709 [Panicum virgatum]|uniref:Uncharacterized protein n=1 Tax=Panicum virgatum TaxID=38727 RepID=A0A8T0UA87_PANVG|nr:hypothetical protein PVAP13_3NG140709 [Panicum virgatum]
MVEAKANNARGWRTVPAQCIGYVKGYMTRGQYLRALAGVMSRRQATPTRSPPTPAPTPTASTLGSPTSPTTRPSSSGRTIRRPSRRGRARRHARGYPRCSGCSWRCWTRASRSSSSPGGTRRRCPLHGREPGSRGLLRVREAHHEDPGVSRAELVGVQVGDEEAARGRRLQDPRERRGPVERPAGRLRRRPRVRDTQSHVLRPLRRFFFPALTCLTEFIRNSG